MCSPQPIRFIQPGLSPDPLGVQILVFRWQPHAHTHRARQWGGSGERNAFYSVTSSLRSWQTLRSVCSQSPRFISPDFSLTSQTTNTLFGLFKPTFIWVLCCCTGLFSAGWSISVISSGSDGFLSRDRTLCVCVCVCAVNLSGESFSPSLKCLHNALNEVKRGFFFSLCLHLKGSARESWCEKTFSLCFWINSVYTLSSTWNYLFYSRSWQLLVRIFCDRNPFRP